MIFLSISCFPQKGKWEKVQKNNTIESYQEFLDNYPRSEFFDDAKQKLIELEYENALSKNTLKSYKDFLNKYKGNKYRSDLELEAKNKIDSINKQIEISNENSAWDEALKNKSLSYFTNFFSRFPNGQRAQIARKQVKLSVLGSSDVIADFSADLQTVVSIIKDILLSENILVLPQDYKDINYEITVNTGTGLVPYVELDFNIDGSLNSFPKYSIKEGKIIEYAILPTNIKKLKLDINNPEILSYILNDGRELNIEDFKFTLSYEQYDEELVKKLNNSIKTELMPLLFAYYYYTQERE